MLREAVDALIVKKNGIYIDATFGRGGHSQAILSALGSDGRLIALDRDPEAVSHGDAWGDERFEMVHASFAQLAEVVRVRGIWGQVSGVLFDLGVSSPQLDQAERGFSFLRDGPLDMRMDTTKGLSASQWLTQVDEQELSRILKTFGEERYAKRIARAIVQQRDVAPIETTLQLVALVDRVVPSKEQHKHKSTRTFQAIRMAVNDELGALQTALVDSLELLAPRGRVVAISFHSGEDRVVKRFFQKEQKGDDYPRDMPITDEMLNRRVKILGKAIKPNSQEVEGNPRARSAIMRVAEKIR